MKKIIKFCLISILLFILEIFAFWKYSEYDRTNYYYKYTETAGEIEEKYAGIGDEKVTCKKYKVNDDMIQEYAIWYPKKLKETNNTYPVVIYANCTNNTYKLYAPLLKHLASWNFITVGNDDQNTRTGESLEKTICFLIKENEDENSIFYHKMDLNNIGIAGHSQGGVAIFNMITTQEHGYMIKAVYVASVTSSYRAEIRQDNWGYDVSNIKVPTFLIAGTGISDTGTATSKEQGEDREYGIIQGISPLWSMQENYNMLPETTLKVMARKTNTDHEDIYKNADGYMTAWFLYHLQNNEEAGEAFKVDGELQNNILYENVETNIK